MNPLFTSIEQLKEVVKINAALPWESIKPYVAEGEAMLAEFFSQSFIDGLQDGDTFFAMARRAVGPMVLYLAMDEMAVSVGDAGITVINERDGKRAPASDAKIAAAKRSLYQRSMFNLSRLISFVMLSSAERYPAIADCPVVSDFDGLLVDSMHSVMKRVNICNDYVTLVRMVPLLRSAQRDLAKSVGDALMAELVAKPTDPDKIKLRSLCKDYVVFRSAYLHTSQTTRVQRSAAATSRGATEWEPVIRPLFEDVTDTGNYYAEEAAKALADIDVLAAAISGENDGDARPAGPTRLRHTAMF